MSDKETIARKERWQALTRYDSEIAPLAEMLSGYGSTWIDQFETAFFALKEDRSYLQSIVSRLVLEAEMDRELELQKVAEAWLQQFSRTQQGEETSEASFKILSKAMAMGFSVSSKNDHTIVVTKKEFGTSYLHSNFEIAQFASIRKF